MTNDANEIDIITTNIELSNFIIQLSSLAQEFVSHLPKEIDSEDLYFKYIESFWNKDTKLPKIVMISSIISVPSAETSIPIFKNSLPNIILNDDKVPVSNTSKISFCSRIQNVDWKNPNIRLSARLVSELTYCNYCNNIVVMLQYFSDQIPILIIKSFIEILSNNENDLASRYHLISAGHFSKCVLKISTVRPQTVLDLFKESLSDIRSMAKNTLCCILLLFSGIQIKSDMQVNISSLEDILSSIYSELKSVQCNSVFHNAALKCIFNICGNAMAADQHFCNGRLLYDASCFAKHFQKMPSYFGSAHILRALLYTFSKHKKLSLTFVQYIKKYIEPNLNKPNFGVMILQSFTIFLRGSNFETTQLMAENGDNYTWRPNEKCGSAFVDYMVGCVSKNISIFANSQYWLSQFLIQYAFISIESFMDTVFPWFKNKKLLDSNLKSFMLIMFELLSNHKVEISQNLKNQIIEFTENVIFDVFNEMPKPPNNSEYESYHCSSFYDILRNNNMEYEKCIRFMLRNSQPQAPVAGGPPILLATLTKWQKILDLKTKPQLFESFQTSIKFIDSPPTEKKVYLIAVNILPYLSEKKEIFDLIITLFISSSPSISCLALQVMEAIIYQQKNNAEYFIEKLIQKLLEAKTLMKEQMYMVFYALSKIFTLFGILNLKISNNLMPLINFALIIGICSSFHVTRSISLSVACLVSQCSEGKSIYSLMIENEHNIAISGQKGALFAVSNITIIPEIQLIDYFQLILSANSYLLQYYTPFMASILLKYRDEIFLQKIHDLVFKYFENYTFDHGDGLHFFSLLIFIANSAHGSFYDQKHLADFETYCKRCANAWKNLEDFKRASYSALFVKVDPTISKDINLFGTRDPLLIYSISFSIRLNVFSSTFNGSDEEINNIFVHLNSLAEFVFSTNSISKNLTFSCRVRVMQTILKLSDTIINILLTISYLFDILFKRYRKKPHGPFPRIDYCIVEGIPNFNRELWWAFIVNFCSDSSVVIELAKTSLHKLLLVTAPPDSEANTIFEFMPYLPSDVIALILSRYFMYLFPRFISTGLSTQVESSKYFNAICDQFYLTNKPDEYYSMAKLSWGKLAKSEKDFSLAVYSRIGSLFAMCLFYMSRSQVNLKILASNLLLNIGLSCLAIINEAETSALYVKLMEKINSILGSDLVSLYQTGVVEISTFLSNHFAFCTEQFVADMLGIIQRHENEARLVSIVLPWIRNVQLDLEAPLVFRDSSLEFTRFTSFSFIVTLVELPVNVETLSLCDSVAESSDSFEKMISLITSACEVDPRVFENVQSILTHFLSQKTEATGKILAEYVSFKHWFYAIIQLGRVDRDFDVAQLLRSYSNSQLLNGKDGITKNKPKDNISSNLINNNLNSNILNNNSINMNGIENEDEKDVNFEYSNICSLVLAVMNAVNSDNSHTLDPFAPIILSFIIITLPVFDFDYLPLLTSFVPDLGKGNSEDEESVIAFIKTMSAKERETFGFECLKWGLCCGDLNLAVRALGFYKNVLLPCNNEIVDAILKAIFCVSKLLSESTNRSNIDDLSCEFSYISVCLQVLEEVVKKLEKTRIDIFWTIISLMRIENNEIVHQAIVFLSYLLKDEACKKKVPDLEKPKIINNDFLNILICSKFQLNSLPYIYDILFEIGNPDMFRTLCLSDTCLQAIESQAAVLAVILIVLSNILHLNGNHRSVFVDITSFFNDDKKICEYLRKLSFSGIDLRQEQENQLIISLFNKMSKEQAESVLTLFTRIISLSQGKNCQCLYFFLAALLKAQTVDPANLAVFARDSTKDHELENSLAKSLFLKELSDSHGKIATFKSGGQIYVFPLVFLEDSIDANIDDWTPGDVTDIFSSVSTFPPLFVVNTTFSQCITLSKLKTANARVRTTPFTRWGEILFKAQSIIMQTGSTIQDLSIFEINGNDFIKDVETFRGIRRNPIIKSRTKSFVLPDAQISFNFQSYHTLSSELFIPSLNFVNEIGKSEILK